MQAAVKIKATVDGLASVEGLERGLNKLDRQAEGLQGSFGRLRGITGGLGSALGSVVPAIGLAGLAALGKKSIDAADNLNDLRQKTGVSVESLSKFGAAANDAGSNLEEVGKSMGKLAKGIVDPTSKANEALKSMGLSSLDASGKIKSIDSVMLDVADRFSKMPDGAQKAALAMDLFGKSGMNLIPMLNQGRDSLEKYKATMSTDMAEASDKFNDSINEITRSIAGPFNQSITALLPTITKLAEGIAAVAIGFSKLPEPLQAIIGGVAGLTGAFIILAPAINAIIGIFTILGGIFAGGGVLATIAGYLGALGPVVAAIGSVLSGLGTILAGVFTGPVGWVALLVAAGVAIYAFRDQVGAAINAVVELYKQFFTMIYDNFIKPYMDAHAALTQYIVDSFITPTQEALSSFATAIYEYINTNFIEPTKALFSTITTYISENFITPVQTAILKFATAAYEYINATFIEPTKALFSTVTTYVAENFIKPVQDAILKFATAAYGYINTNFIEPAKKVFTEVTTFISEKFVKPVQDTINGMIKNIGIAFQSIKDAITKPFEAAMQMVKGIVNSILNGIGNAISSVVSAINNVIQGANRALANLKLPQIPMLPQPQLPRFAKGGVVDSPTLAMVGEGGEREYIIPESKMAAASANYMSGARGGAVIPAFANGGVVGPSRTAQGRNSTATIKPQINIQTGPVMQMGGTNYVTMQDLGRAVQTGVRQTLNIIQGDMNMRSQMGLS